jgi:hypothetical protein
MRYPAPADWFEHLASSGTVQRLFWEAADNSLVDLGLERLAVQYPQFDAQLGRLVEEWMRQCAEEEVPPAGLTYHHLFRRYCRLACLIISSGLEVPMTEPEPPADHLSVGANRLSALRAATLQWPVAAVTLIFAARLCEIAHELIVMGNRSPRLRMEIPNSSLIAKYVRTIKDAPVLEALVFEAVQELAHIPHQRRVAPSPQHVDDET